jgi:hypothetical protein
MSAETTKISQKGAANPSTVPSESTPIQVMSSEDSIIADLVKEQPTLEQIASMKVTTRRTTNLLELPEECLPLHGKKYRFAWLSRGKDLTVKLRTSGWVLCNRTNSPYIKSSRFGAHGAIEQAGMLLAFMPEEMAVEMDMGPVRQSQARVKHFTKDIFKQQDPNAGVSFYKPEEKDEE